MERGLTRVPMCVECAEVRQNPQGVVHFLGCYTAGAGQCAECLRHSGWAGRWPCGLGANIVEIKFWIRMANLLSRWKTSVMSVILTSTTIHVTTMDRFSNNNSLDTCRNSLSNTLIRLVIVVRSLRKIRSRWTSAP